MSDLPNKALVKLYPQTHEISWYQSLPTLSNYNIISLDSVFQLTGLGGGISTMSRIILTIEDKLDLYKEPKQLRLLAKILASSPPVLKSHREVTIYQEIIQPLVTDFSSLNHDELFHLLQLEKYKEPMPTQSSPNVTQKTLLDHVLSQEQFKAPHLYYGEIDEETCGKFILMGEIFANAAHAGSYFGAIPHNKGRDLVTITAPFPTLNQIDISMKAFSAIAKLHAKYWNNQYNNIPHYLPSYEWYFDKQGKEDYDQFVSYGSKSWQNYLPQLEHGGLIVSDYFKSIVKAMCDKSSWDNFCNIYHPNDPNTRKIPLSVIHCDYYPSNTMISSSNLYAGVVESDSSINCRTNQTFTPDQAHFFIFDYEFTCVGCPAQDLTQWAIAQLSPELLVKYEDALLQQYYQQLEFYYTLYYNESRLKQGLGAAQVDFSLVYPFAHFHHDYTQQCSKWVWLILVTTSIIGEVVTCDWLQFFVNQVEHFLKLHKITPDNVPIFHR